MKLKKLSEVADVISGSTPKTTTPDFWNGDILWATPKDLSILEGKYLLSTASMITEAGYNSCSTRMIPPNSVLYSSRAPIGHIAINTVEVCTNQGFKSFVPNELITTEYLYYALKYYTPQIQTLGRGATFKEVSKTSISNFEIFINFFPFTKINYH